MILQIELAVQELTQYPISKVCELLQIAPSTVYDHRNHTRKNYAYTETEQAAVYESFMEHNGDFGRWMLKHILEKKDIFRSERKISSIIKQMGCHSKYSCKKGKNVHSSPHTQKYI